MIRWRTLLVSFVLVLVGFLHFFEVEVKAHGVEHPRELYLHVGRNGVELRVFYTVPPGDVAFRTRMRFDFDRDGYLSDLEFEELKRHLVRDAVRGLRISFQGRPVSIRVYDVMVELARESSSSLEMNVSLVVPIWLSQPPPPPYFEIGVMEERFQHTHIYVRSDFRLERKRGKLKRSDGMFHGELKRAEPLVIRFFPR